jgi:hypothetical protein
MLSGSTNRLPRILSLSRLSIPVVIIIIINVLVIVAGPA